MWNIIEGSFVLFANIIILKKKFNDYLLASFIFLRAAL